MNNQDLIDRQMDAYVEVLLGPGGAEIRPRRPVARKARRRWLDPVVVLAWLGCTVVGLLTLVGAVTVARWIIQGVR